MENKIIEDQNNKDAPTPTDANTIQTVPSNSTTKVEDGQGTIPEITISEADLQEEPSATPAAEELPETPNNFSDSSEDLPKQDLSDFTVPNTSQEQVNPTPTPSKARTTISRYGIPLPVSFSAFREKIRRQHHRARYVSPASERSNKYKRLNFVKKFLFEFFATRDMAPPGDRELFVKYSIRQFTLFMFFLLCLSVVAYISKDEYSFFLQKLLSDTFVDSNINEFETKTFRQISSVEDFWSFLDHGIYEKLYWEEFYNAMEHNHTHDYVYNVEKLENPSKFGLFYENELIGIPRLRQLRVENNNCPLAEEFRHLNRKCYPTYTKAAEDRGDKKTKYWPPPKDSKSNWRRCYPQKYKEAWRYRTEAELQGTWHWGDIATYGGGGAIQKLARTKAETHEIIDTLKRYNWVEKSTRVVFLDFTVYNANVDIFCIVRLTFEFPATGGVIAIANIDPMHIPQYEDWYEYNIVDPCETLVLLLTIYFVIQEIIEISISGYTGFIREYARNVWVWLDWAIIMNVFVAFAAGIYDKTLIAKTFRKMNIHSESKFYNFEYLTYWHDFYQNSLSIGMWFCWLKMFKYVAFNKTMTLLAGTLNRCSQDIAGFSVLFFVVFISFAQLGYLQFGPDVKDFRTLEDAIFTLLRLILWDFDTYRLERASPVIGPIYFVAYVFFILFVLLNMFLAIMNDTYSEQKAEIQTQRHEFELSDYVVRGFNNLLGVFGCRRTSLDAEAAVKLASADGQLTYDEIRKNFKRDGFDEMELEVFLAKFNITTEHCLDEDEAQKWLDFIQNAMADRTKKVKSSVALISETSKAITDFEPFLDKEFKTFYIINNEDVAYEDKLNEIEARVLDLEYTFSTLISKLNDVMTVL